MADSTAEDLKTLRAELANLRADLGRISETLKDVVKHGRDEAAEKLQDEIGRRTERLSREIEQKPLTAVFTAFGLGVLLGMLFGGRRS